MTEGRNKTSESLKNDLSSENDESLTKITRLQNEILIAQKMIALREQEIKFLTEPNIDLDCDNSGTDSQQRRPKPKETKRPNEPVKRNAVVESKSKPGSTHVSRDSPRHKTTREVSSNREGRSRDEFYSEESWSNDNEKGREAGINKRIRKQGRNCRRNHQRTRRRNLRQKLALERKMKQMIENEHGTEKTEGSKSAGNKNVPTKDVSTNVEKKVTKKPEQKLVPEVHKQKTSDNTAKATGLIVNREEIINDLEDYSLSESEDSDGSYDNEFNDEKTRETANSNSSVDRHREYGRKKKIANQRLKALESQMKELIANRRVQPSINKNIPEASNTRKKESGAKGSTPVKNVSVENKHDNSQQRKRKPETETKRNKELIKTCVGAVEKKAKTVPSSTVVSRDSPYSNSKEIVLNRDEIMRFLGENSINESDESGDTSSELDLQDEETKDQSSRKQRTGQYSRKPHRTNVNQAKHQRMAVERKIKKMIDNNQPVKITEGELNILNFGSKNQGDCRPRIIIAETEKDEKQMLEQFDFTTVTKSVEPNNEKIIPECDILNFI